MLLRGLTTLLVILLIALITIANTGNGQFLLTILNTVPHGDKWLHLFLMGTLTAALNLSLNFRKTDFRNKSILTGTLIMFCLITVEEFSQAFIPYRNFEVLDLVCNYLGIFGIGQIPFFFKQYLPTFILKNISK